jgi:hypothetical protein
MAIEDNLDPTQEEEDSNVFLDVLKAPFRGIEGAVQGVYQLADFVTGDILPDYDRRFLGESTSIPGNIVEDITQFAAGFVPVAGWLGKAGKVSRARKLLGDDVARQLAYGGELTAKQMAAISKTSKAASFARNMAAGMSSDFLVFDGQEERLSNFLYQYPAFQNPVVDYLRATESDNEIEGRFKNVLEGLFIELGIETALMVPFIKNVKMIKNRSKKVAEGKAKEDATQEALEEADLTQDELLGIGVEPEVKPKDLDGDAAAKATDETTAPKDEQQLEMDLGDERLDTEQTYDTSTIQGAESTVKDLAKTLKTGGEQALRSTVRLVTDQTDLVTLVRAVARNKEELAKESGQFLKTTKEELLAEASDMVDAYGGNINAIEKELQRLQRYGKSFEEFSREQMAVKELNNIIAGKTYELAEATRGLAKGSDEYEKNMADIMFHMDLLSAAQSVWAQFGRTGSLTLLQRKYIYGDIKAKKIDNIPEDISIKDIHKFRDKRLGSLSDDKLLDLIVSSKSADDIQVGLNKIAKGSFGSRMMDMAQEYWMNSVLSAPTTQIINIIGSAITYAVDTTEKLVGSALTGNFALTKATLQYSFNMNAIAEAFSLAAKTMKNGEAISIPEARAFSEGAKPTEAIRIAEKGRDDAFAQTFNFLGNLVRMPSRGLLVGDEFFKAFNYRSYVATELAAEAIQKGLKGKDRAKYVADRISGYITETGRIYNEASLMREVIDRADKQGLKFGQRQRFISSELAKEKAKPFVLPDGTKLSYKDRGAIASRAEQMAKVNTHTQDSDNLFSNFIGRAVNKHPLLKFVFPFIRTPTNILSFGVKRSPFGSASAIKLLSSKYRQQLASGSPTETAQAYGRIATSVSSLAALLYFFQSGKGGTVITGSGPRNPEQKKVWELDNQEYSIKVGDKWVSYNRLDPMATILGIVADMSEAHKYNDIDDNTFAELFSVAGIALANNVTNKSYVQGLDNLFTMLQFKSGDIRKDTNRFLGNIAGGFVPNIVNQSMSYEEDRALREASDWRDMVIKRTPLANQMLAPRRNVLGEIQTVPSSGGYAGVINPIYVKERPGNIVDEELANLGVGFKHPDRYLGAGVEELDMKEYYNPETGQQAYDRMLELIGTSKLRGKTLRERLEIMFNSNEYQQLGGDNLRKETGYHGPKVQAVRRLLDAYRGIAKHQMLKENPELHMRKLQAMQKRREAFRSGQ